MSGLLSRLWQAPRVRAVRHRISDAQSWSIPVAGLGMRIWCGLVRRFVRYDRRGQIFEYLQAGKPRVIALWHQDVWPLMADLLHYTPRYPSLDMVSGGRVGTLGVHFAIMYGIECVIGSSAHRGREPVDELTHRARTERRSVFIMADGSRGPAPQARWGALHIARDTGLPIIPVRAWGTNLWLLRNTWMRLAAPFPWGRAVLLSAEPLRVPPDADKTELEAGRLELERRLNAMCDAAQAYFTTGPAAVDPWGPPVAPPVLT